MYLGWDQTNFIVATIEIKINSIAIQLLKPEKIFILEMYKEIILFPNMLA